MQIAVINLASEEARWTAVQRQFDAVGLEPAHVDAVVGRTLAPCELSGLYSEALNRRSYHKPLQAGEVGCYASHIGVWQRLLESKQAHLAVFEDDIDIDADLAQALAALAQMPADWDLVKLIGRQHEKVQARTPLIPGRDLVEYRRVPGLTSAYVINRRGAEKLLSHRIPFGRPIDVDLRHWWECDLRILGMHPYPARAAASSRLSTIEGRRGTADVHTRLRKLMLQTRYTVLNWQATHAGARPAAQQLVRLSAHFVDHPMR